MSVRTPHESDDVAVQSALSEEVVEQSFHQFCIAPGDERLFAQLSDSFRTSRDIHGFTAIHELRARFVSSPEEKFELLKAAGDFCLSCGAQEHGVQLYIRSLEFFPLAPEFTSPYSKTIQQLLENNSFAPATSLLQATIDAQSTASNSQQGNEQRMLLARLWERHLGRLDLAAEQWFTVWKLDPSHNDALVYAKEALFKLADFKRLKEVLLSESEESSFDTSQRASAFLALANLAIRQKQEDPAHYLRQALALTPNSLQAKKLLVEILLEDSSSEESINEALEHLIAIAEQLADESPKDAIHYLERAAGLREDLPLVLQALEKHYQRQGDTQSLLVLKEKQLSNTADPLKRTQLLYTMTRLAEELGESRKYQLMLEALIELEPPGGKASKELRALYQKNSQWRELASLLERELPTWEHDVQRKTQELLELASITHTQLQNADRAGELLHQALSLSPSNEEAFSKYAEYFRQRRDWRGLVRLHEYSYESGKQAGLPASTLISTLENISEIAEMRLGDIPRALSAWQQILSHRQNYPKAQEAMRRLSARQQMWDSLVSGLEQEAQRAQTSEERVEVLRRMAQTFRERRVSPQKAIAIYEEILGYFPHDTTSNQAALELYEREGNTEGVVRCLRRKLDIDIEQVRREATARGTQPLAPKDWPTEKRVERITVLRKLLSLYDNKLGDTQGVLFSSAGILEILPADRDTLHRMERFLERVGEMARLAETLEYHAQVAGNPPEKSRFYKKLAKLANDRNDEAAALNYWEHVYQNLPSDEEARNELKQIYARLKRWTALANLLDTSLSTFPTIQPDSQEFREMVQLARLYTSTVSDPERASHWWENIRRIEPNHPEALRNLVVYHQGGNSPRLYATILEQYVSCIEESDPSEAASYAIELANLHQESGNEASAITLFQKVTDQLAPDHLEALRQLYALQLAVGQTNEALKTAERMIRLTPSLEEKVTLLLEIQRTSQNRLSDSFRALDASMRLTTTLTDETDVFFQGAAAAEKIGAYPQQINFLQELLTRTSESEQTRVHQQLGFVYAKLFVDPAAAGEHFVSAYEKQPNLTTMAAAVDVLDQFQLWNQKQALLQAARRRAIQQHRPQQIVTIAGTLATHLAQHNKDTIEALEVLGDSIQAVPGSQTLVETARTLASADPSESAWDAYVTFLNTTIAVSPPARKGPLLMEKSNILSRYLNREEDAMVALMEAYAWFPGEPSIVDEIRSLAHKTNSWQDLQAVLTSEATRTNNLQKRCEYLLERADLETTHLHDPVGGFRTLLSVLYCTPRDGKLNEKIWETIPQLPKYSEENATPSDDLPLATVHNYERADTEDLEVEELDVVEVDTSKPPPLPPSGKKPENLVSLGALPVCVQETFESPWEELVANYLAIAKLDPPRIFHLERAVRAWEIGAKTPAKALALLSRELQTTDDAPPIESLLKELGEKYGRWDDVIHSFENAAESATRLDDATNQLLQGAQIAFEQEKFHEAEPLLRRILGMQPSHKQARKKLTWILRNEKRYSELATLFEEYAAPRFYSSAEEHAEHLDELAALYTEKLQRPADGAEILVRLDRVRPNNVELQDRLVNCYEQLGKWRLAIQHLRKKADLQGDEDQGAMQRIAFIYEEKLQLPERAAQVYEDALVRSPENQDYLTKLRTLYSQLKRFRPLEKLLQTAAAATSDKVRRSQLLLERAQLLVREFSEYPEALTCLQAANALTPDDAEVFTELVAVHAQADRAEDAQTLLEQRIQRLSDSPESLELPERMTQLGLLRANSLNNPDGAIELLRSCTERFPDYAPAVEALNRQTHGQQDPQAYAKKQIEEAEQTTDSSTKISLYLSAADALKPLPDEQGTVRSLYERILEIDPYHSKSVQELSLLLEKESNFDEAKALLKQQLQRDDLPNPDAATFHRRLARLAMRSDDANGASTHFQKALSLDPHNLDVAFEVTHLLELQKKFQEILTALAPLLDQEGLTKEQKAELYRRIAIAHEGLNQRDEAHRYLIKADRLDRDNLLVILALGHNRYRARRWRDAALHLSKAGTHPNASFYVEDVANALYHAALAEIRSMRPQKARPLYERALELFPDHGPTLRALAEQEMEEGNNSRAIELLSTYAHSAQSPAERARLFETVGDLIVQNHGESKNSLDAYRLAVENLGEEVKLHGPLLEKLLIQQEECSDLSGIAETSQILAGLEGNSMRKAAFYCRAAEIHDSLKAHDKARFCIEQAVEADDEHLESFVLYGKLISDKEKITHTLGRALHKFRDVTSGDSAEAALVAQLWVTLAQARHQRGDTSGAEAAIESALTLAPDSSAGIEARRCLVTWAGESASTRPDLYQHLERLAQETLAREDFVRLAHSDMRMGQKDRARGLLELAIQQGHTPDLHETAFLTQNQPDSATPVKPVSAQVIEDIVNDTDGSLAEIAAILWPAVRFTFPAPEQAASSHPEEISKLLPADGIPVGPSFVSLTRAMSGTQTFLYKDEATETSVQVLSATHPTIIFGGDAIRKDLPSDLAFFYAGQAMEYIQESRLLLSSLSRMDFETIIHSAVLQYGPKDLANSLSAGKPEMAHQLHSSLPVKSRELLRTIFSNITAAEIDYTRFREEAQRAADRRGFIASGNIVTALKFASGDQRHIQKLCLDKRFYDVRRQMTQ